MSLFSKLRNELQTYLEPPQVEEVYKAYRVATSAHKGQLRWSGEAYITHPVAVARILAAMHMDHQSIMAALLHDVIEDTGVDKLAISAQFGEEVAELVDGVTKLTQIEFETKAEAQAENFRKMVLAMARDLRVIIVKLADRLHNMRTITSLPTHKRNRMAMETLEIYAPIANRLGMHNFRIEFEDLSFAAIHPMRYRALKDAMVKARGHRREILSLIQKALQECLEQHQLPIVAVWGREKHLYSIYQKMRNKHSPFSEIMDVYGFRIVVNNVDTCYRVLGAVHNLYKPVPERFKDYIAIPKANGYQSLHTTLFGPFGVPIEIQIRTQEMDYMANNGIAAHWLYKSPEGMLNDAQIRAREWLKGLVEIQQSTGSSLEFIENVKIDLFPDEVYVFTPKGMILELPSGASAVDFAYAVHSDIGNSCVAVKIDRRLAPLSTALSSGQTIEVITAPGARPNPAWLNFVVTGKARSNIRHFLKSQQRAESISLGKRLMAKALAALSNSWEQLPPQNIDDLLQEFQYEKVDDLFEAIGLGNQMALVIAHRLMKTADHVDVPGFDRKSSKPLLIKGSEGIVVNFAECCKPIPGDPIVGFLSAGHGIIIHQEECPYVSNFKDQAEKRIDVRWEDKVQGEFKVDLRAEVINKRGVLAKLAGAIAEANANIESLVIHEQGNCNIIHLTITVHDRIHLARVLRKIRAVKVVEKIMRVHQ